MKPLRLRPNTDRTNPARAGLVQGCWESNPTRAGWRLDPQCYKPAEEAEVCLREHLIQWLVEVGASQPGASGAAAVDTTDAPTSATKP